MIYTGGVPATSAAKAATATIPIVFGIGDDPVEAGFVTSFNRPEGNVTGISFMDVHLTAKRFGLLHELLPAALRFAVLVNPNPPRIAATVTADAQTAASTLGRQIEFFAASTNGEIDAAFASMMQRRVDALLIGPGPLFTNRRAQLATLAARHALPVWCMCLGWMFFNTVFYGLVTWLPNYLFSEHGFNIATLGGATFIIFFSGFVGELVGGWISDKWRAGGGRPSQVYRTMFAVAALFATVSIFAVGYVRSPIVVVALLSVVLFFLRWCGVYWAIPSILATRDRAGFLGGCMNLVGNIAGITVPIIVGFIVQITGSYFLAMMFFAGAGIAFLICSTAIDYSRKLPV